MPERSSDSVRSARRDSAREQRARLLDSFTKLAAEGGYRSVDGSDAARRAGLSPEAFREHFDDELRCLIAAYDAFFARLNDDIADAVRDEQAWPLRVRKAVAACLTCLAEMESRARLFGVEALAAGPAILERRFAHTAHVAERLRSGRRHFPAADLLPQSIEWNLIAGAGARVTSYLLAEQAALLPRLERELTELLLVPYMGAGDARRVIEEAI